MAINVAGTNAIANYLVGQIQNTQILFGEAAPTFGPSAATPAPGTALTPSQLAQQVASAKLSNTDALFGLPAQSTDPLQSALLASFDGASAQVISPATLPAAAEAQSAATTATLFGSLGYGANVDALA
jgi:hypothetical protein